MKKAVLRKRKKRKEDRNTNKANAFNQDFRRLTGDTEMWRLERLRWSGYEVRARG